MSNTITAYFKGRVGVAESVYQNDYGIVMAFDSIDLPAHFDCYFSRLNQEEALPGLGADNRVTIPNSILANPGNVTIHIPLHTGEDDSEVEYVIYFKVIGRARPIDDGTPTQMTAIERALALLSQPITNIEEIVNEALSFTGDTFAEMKAELQEDYSDFTSDVNADIAAFQTETRSDIADVESDFYNLNAQFQTAVSALTVDSEVQGVRVGEDNATYPTAGDAVRKQIGAISEKTKNLLISNPITATVVGATVTSDGRGKFKINGTATSNGGRTTKLTGWITIPAGTYTLSIRCTSAPSGTLYLNDTSNNNFTGVNFGANQKVTFTREAETTFYVGCGLSNATSYDLVIEAQLEVGSTATAFVPSQTAVDNKVRTELAAYIGKTDPRINGKFRLIDDGTFKIDESKFTRGDMDISTSGWSYITSTTRVRTNEGYTIHFDGGERIGLTSYNGYRYFLGWLTTNNEYKLKGWLQTDFIVEDEGEYVILIAKSPDATSTKEELLSLLRITKSANLEYLYEKASVSATFDDLKPSALKEFKNAIPFSIADIISNAGSDFGKLGSNKFRLSTTNICKFDYDIAINIGSGFKFCYYRYETTESETAIPASNSNWYTGIFVMPRGTCFRLQLAKYTEDQAIIIDAIDNDLFRALSMEPLDDDEGSKIPDYWQSTLASKESTINTINEYIGGNGVSFVFVTDYHQNSSNKASTRLIRHIFDNTSVDTVVYGGDTTDGIGSTAECLAKVREYAAELKQFNALNVRGNHDCEPTANTTTNQISEAQYYDACVRSLEKITDTNGKPYYYYDNTSQKVRYIIMDSGGMDNPLNETQLGWLKNALTELSSEWTVIIIQHVVVEQNNSQQTIHLSSRGEATLDAIGEVYASLNCTIAALICGHAHVDGMLDTDYNFKVIATTCDSGGANAAYDWNNPTRTGGTTNECAFDVFSIDKANREINITRIGAGTDRTATY